MVRKMIFNEYNHEMADSAIKCLILVVAKPKNIPWTYFLCMFYKTITFFILPISLTLMLASIVIISMGLSITL